MYMENSTHMVTIWSMPGATSPSASTSIADCTCNVGFYGPNGGRQRDGGNCTRHDPTLGCARDEFGAPYQCQTCPPGDPIWTFPLTCCLLAALACFSFLLSHGNCWWEITSYSCPFLVQASYWWSASTFHLLFASFHLDQLFFSTYLLTCCRLAHFCCLCTIK